MRLSASSSQSSSHPMQVVLPQDYAQDHIINSQITELDPSESNEGFTHHYRAEILVPARTLKAKTSETQVQEVLALLRNPKVMRFVFDKVDFQIPESITNLSEGYEYQSRADIEINYCRFKISGLNENSFTSRMIEPASDTLMSPLEFKFTVNAGSANVGPAIVFETFLKPTANFPKGKNPGEMVKKINDRAMGAMLRYFVDPGSFLDKASINDAITMQQNEKTTVLSYKLRIDAPESIVKAVLSSPQHYPYYHNRLIQKDDKWKFELNLDDFRLPLSRENQEEENRIVLASSTSLFSASGHVASIRLDISWKEVSERACTIDFRYTLAPAWVAAVATAVLGGLPEKVMQISSREFLRTFVRHVMMAVYATKTAANNRSSIAALTNSAARLTLMSAPVASVEEGAEDKGVLEKLSFSYQ